jgi:hypothetical protein
MYCTQRISEITFIGYPLIKEGYPLIKEADNILVDRILEEGEP